MSALRVLVAGALAAKAGHGGEAWVRLGWLRGLQQLGCDVRFVEVADLDTDSAAGSAAADWSDHVLASAHLGGRASLLTPAGGRLRGLPLTALTEFAADVLLDVSGTLRGAAPVTALRDAVPKRVYVDVDPGHTQLWHADGLLGDQLTRYTTHVTVGDAVAGCGLPDGGFRWHATRPPVALADWPLVAPGPATLSTVASWRGAFGPLVRDGVVLGAKVHEFRRLADVPRQVPQRCEVALDVHPADAGDVDALRAGGWTVRDPRPLTGTPEAYRRFVQASGGELSAAQGMYVTTRCGWVSDRTAAYLASGRPAIVQDTGFGPELRRAGAGLLPFSTPEQAVDACRIVARDPAGHAAAARALAEEHFAADRVVGRVLELAGAA